MTGKYKNDKDGFLKEFLHLKDNLEFDSTRPVNKRQLLNLNIED